METPESADCVVVGAGAVGCAVALGLASQGLSTVIVDRAGAFAEASGAAAGILAPQIEATGPGPWLDLALASRARWPEFVNSLDDVVGWRAEGAIEIGDDRELGARAAWQEALGLPVERLDARSLVTLERALAPLEESQIALRFGGAAQIDPPLLRKALVAAMQRKGARLLIASVRRIDRHPRVTGVVLSDGRRIATGRVVLAAGAWSPLVEGAPPLAVKPMRGELIELAGPRLLVKHVVFARGGYLVSREDGRVVVGSTMEDVGFDRSTTAAARALLLERARAMVPALAGASVLRVWAGLRPVAIDGPYLGASGVPGLVLATGHGRNGILLAPITAERVLAAVLAPDGVH